ncbi:hypothetical protein NKW44_13440 [Acetobacter lovaniensis]|jgi:hypothetical protein|uniref:hypothetical protein n=1 Tax=Acetobacter lovaniensis TaxID=104100 RepID=UPI0020A03268|nr:hypothetical protein [Acetobacter lovaniensis]MCP1240670.1 hypothetical protein [Acetobacter lovaniensis]
MSAASIGIEGALEALDGAAGVASVRAWMERHREALLAHQDGRRINWRALCDWFASVGLLNGKGQTPTIRCAQLTWYRVGKWLERRNERAAERAAETLRLEAERESEKAAIQAEIRQRREAEAAEKAALRDKMEQVGRDVARRVQAQTEAPTIARVARNEQPPSTDVDRQENVPQHEARVRIGEVARVVRMRTQAPRYGRDRDIPLPPPYVGPRPAGMPEDLPLEALMPLDAPGLDDKGMYDVKQLPGMPRRSFYDNEREWAMDCMAMIKPIPPLERPRALKAMATFLTMKLGPSYRG